MIVSEMPFLELHYIFHELICGGMMFVDEPELCSNLSPIIIEFRFTTEILSRGLFWQ